MRGGLMLVVKKYKPLMNEDMACLSVSVLSSIFSIAISYNLLFPYKSKIVNFPYRYFSCFL